MMVGERKREKTRKWTKNVKSEREMQKRREREVYQMEGGGTFHLGREKEEA